MNYIEEKNMMMTTNSYKNCRIIINRRENTPSTYILHFYFHSSDSKQHRNILCVYFAHTDPIPILHTNKFTPDTH